MKIEWNKVTWYSKLLALALFVLLPFIGSYFGAEYQREIEAVQNMPYFHITHPARYEPVAPPAEINFSKDGNLVKNGGSWSLLYEAPGTPALSAKLVFTDMSRCISRIRVPVSCTASSWNAGARVHTEGNLNADGLFVATLTFR